MHRGIARRTDLLQGDAEFLTVDAVLFGHRHAIGADLAVLGTKQRVRAALPLPFRQAFIVVQVGSAKAPVGAAVTFEGATLPRHGVVTEKLGQDKVGTLDAARVALLKGGVRRR